MMKTEKLNRVLDDLFKTYYVFIGSEYSNASQPTHIKKLAKKLTLLEENGGRLCVSMPPRHKLADSTPILTPNGWTTHGELEVGDSVYGLNGEPTKIIGVSEKSPCNQLITFSDNSQIIAHEDHLWTVNKRGNKNNVTLSTSEIKKNYYYIEKNGKKRYRYHLPFIKPIQYDKTILPLDPYFLGLWLGDGSSTKPCITHAPEDIEPINHVPYEVSTVSTHKDTGVKTTYFSNQNIIKTLKELNLYNNKHIPDIYKRASIEDRIELLAGLIDSDGSVDKNGRVRFVNVNKRLIDDVYELCVGLGLYPYVSIRKKDDMNRYKRNSEYDIKSTCDVYVVGFQPKYTIPTQIPRKKVKRTATHRRLAITNIETVDEELGKCIEIENDDGIYLAGEKLIPTHNSKSSMVTLAFPLWLIWHNPDLNILIVNNSVSLSKKFGIKLRELFKQYEGVSGVYLSEIKHSSTHLMFQNGDGDLYGGSIRLVGAGGSITGQDADYLIIDDPYAGFSDITPTLLEKTIDWFDIIIEQRLEPESRLIICHTRWSENDLQGYLEKNHPEDYSFISFSAIEDDGELLWPERYNKEFLETKRLVLGERQFQSIYQQKPLDQTSDFFDIDNIDFDRTIDPKEIVYSVRSWDIASGEAKHNDYTAGVLMHKLKDDTYYINDLVHGRYGNSNKDILLQTAKQDGVNTQIRIETGVAAAADLLYHEWKEQLQGYKVVQSKPRGKKNKAKIGQSHIVSKVDRATPLQNAVYDHKLSVNLQDKKLRGVFIQEFKSFPEGLHDDIIDAASYAYNYLKTKLYEKKELPLYIEGL